MSDAVAHPKSQNTGKLLKLSRVNGFLIFFFNFTDYVTRAGCRIPQVRRTAVGTRKACELHTYYDRLVAVAMVFVYLLTRGNVTVVSILSVLFAGSSGIA